METEVANLSHNETSTATITQSEKWLIVYAKITLDKVNGITLHGVYLGGIGTTKQEAEDIARNCVNTIKGGTIIPKIFQLSTDKTIIDILYEASDRFESTTARMQEVESIIHRNKKK